jgi:hypothetical protein
MLAPAAFALDASTEHHDLIYGWHGIDQDRIRHRAAAGISESDGYYVCLLAPGEGIQLTLPIVELQGLSEAAIVTLRKWRGPEGLRHWVALLRLLSEIGHRSGQIQWTCQEHIARLGYDPREARDPELARRVSAFMGFFLSIEIAIYTNDHRMRDRMPLFSVLLTQEHADHPSPQSERWIRDTVTLAINPLIYGGVRTSSGKVGRNWTTAPSALSEVDHVRYPYVVGLSLILLIRLRWRWTENAHTLTLKADTLLDLAGIRLVTGRPARAWTALERTLDKCVSIGVVDRYEWSGAAWSTGGSVVFHRAPVEVSAESLFLPRKPVVRWNGAQIAAWRGERGITVRQAGAVLGVAHTTIARAEAQPGAPIGGRLRAAIERFLSSPEDGPPGAAAPSA